jgi:hypothetical protein
LPGARGLRAPEHFMERTRMSLAKLCLALSIAVTPLYGQSVVHVTASRAAYSSFERVLGMLNKPEAELSRIWPAPLTGSRALADLRLTAAHTIHAFVSEDPERRGDTTHRVLNVALIEQFTDSLTFLARTNALLADYTAKFGAPNECSLPFGPPAFLSVSQNPARIWMKGAQGAMTVIDWLVSKEHTYVLTVYVGKFTGTLGQTMPCNAPLP